MKITEPNLTPTAKKIVEKRYLKTDMEGKVIETPGEMLWRVAQHLAKAEVNWDGIDQVEQSAKDFYERMVNLKFVVAGKALFEAGNPGGTGQLSSCFVLPVEDNIHSIFKTLGDAAVVHKNNGGTGFNFSKIRPRGDKVKNVPGASSGPVDFLAAYSAALSKILQGSKRQGANIGILNADHPDIIDFITLKDEDGTIKNFNVSVGVTNEFMEAVEQDKKWKLINPRNGEVVKKIKARKLFDLIVEHAWATGDPGLAFLDRMEQDNPTPSIAKLDCTNPCGEIPLLPYESCNLNSIVLNNHLITHQDGTCEIDWDDLEHSVKTGIRLLDNMIEVNTYALPEIEQMVKFGNRRIGLGVMGFAHLLFKLSIPYDSQDAVRLSERLAKFIHRKAEEMSLQLGEERGVFPHWDISIYAGSAERYRNCALTMIAPTGTISMMANTSSGIEPVFSLVTKRKTFFEGDRKNRPTEELMFVDPIFEEYLKNKFKNQKSKSKRGEGDSERSQVTNHKSQSDSNLTIEQCLERIAETNSLEDIDILDKKEKRIFTTTHQIKPEWHVKIQAAWQKYFDNSISKTVNFSHEATVEDVKTVYMLAWRLGCKGVTIYRDGSKADQVLNLAKQESGIRSQKSEGEKSMKSNRDSDSENPQITNHKSQSKDNLTIYPTNFQAISPESLTGEQSSAEPSQVPARNATHSVAGGSSLNPQLSLPALHTSAPCPECGAQVVMSEGCGTCHECGWSQCKL